MALVKDSNPSISTLVIDAGLVNPLVVWVDKPIRDVLKDLSDGQPVEGDSHIGAVWFFQSAVKIGQTGKREINIATVDRSSGALFPG